MRITRKCGRQHTDMTSDPPQPQTNACLTVNDSWKATKRSKIATDSGINGQSQSQSEPKPPKGRQHAHTHTSKLATKWRLEYACVRVCCHGSRQMKTPVALRPKIDKETEEQQEGERKGDRKINGKREREKRRERERKMAKKVHLTLRLFYLAAFLGDNNRQNGRQ